MRFSRDSAMTMPPATGRAPPESPVPWPRATNGTALRGQSRTTAWTSAADDGQHDRGRRLAQMRQRVAFVGQQLERLVEHARGAHDPPQPLEKCAVHMPIEAKNGRSAATSV